MGHSYFAWRIWKCTYRSWFQRSHFSGSPYLSQPRNLALLPNCLDRTFASTFKSIQYIIPFDRFSSCCGTLVYIHDITHLSSIAYSDYEHLQQWELVRFKFLMIQCVKSNFLRQRTTWTRASRVVDGRWPELFLSLIIILSIRTHASNLFGYAGGAQKVYISLIWLSMLKHSSSVQILAPFTLATAIATDISIVASLVCLLNRERTGFSKSICCLSLMHLDFTICTAIGLTAWLTCSFSTVSKSAQSLCSLCLLRFVLHMLTVTIIQRGWSDRDHFSESWRSLDVSF